MTRTPTRLLLGAFLAALLTAGGFGGQAMAATGKSTAKMSKDPFGDLVNQQRQLAKDAESEDDLPVAIAHWEYVASAAPNDATAKAKVVALKKEAKDKAAQYFKTGFAEYQQQNIGPAFKALLKGLAYDPTNKEAIHLVKDELNAKSIIDYTVESGDTIASIADKNKKEGYDDPNLAMVIARYNNLKPDAKLSAGQQLEIPVLVGVLPSSAPAVAGRKGARPPAEPTEEASELDDTKTNAQADQARDLLKQNKFDDAVKLASKVLDEDPLNKDARDVKNAANMAKGQQLFDAKNFEAALTVFSQVDSSYPKQPESVAAAKSHIRDQAELDYQDGVRYFLNDDLDNAIKSFEACLKINPNHPQAKKDLETAKETRDKLRNLK